MCLHYGTTHEYTRCKWRCADCDSQNVRLEWSDKDKVLEVRCNNCECLQRFVADYVHGVRPNINRLTFCFGITRNDVTAVEIYEADRYDDHRFTGRFLLKCSVWSSSTQAYFDNIEKWLNERRATREREEAVA